MTSPGLAMLPSTAVAMIVAVPWVAPAVTRPVEGSYCCFFEKKRGKE